MASAREGPGAHLTCSMCLEPFKGRNPKILPCFHTYCLPCLDALVESLSAQKLPDDSEKAEKADCDTDKGDCLKDGKAGELEAAGGGCEKQAALEKIIQCPTCRTPVTIPDGGVTKLQTNFYLDMTEEAESEAGSGPEACQMCPEGSEARATHQCRECDQKLCAECREMHNRFKSLQDHQITSLPPPKVPKVPRGWGRERGRCPIHKDQTLCFLCRQCDVGICLHCKLTRHEGHETVDVMTAEVEAVADMTSLVPKAQEQLAVLNSYQRHLVRQGCEVSRHSSRSADQINARFTEIQADMHRVIQCAKDNRDRLLEELAAKEEDAQNQLHAKKSSLMAAKETLTTAVDLASSARADGGDIVAARRALEAALMAEGKVEETRAEGKEPILPPTWQFKGKPPLNPDLQQMGDMGKILDGDEEEEEEDCEDEEKEDEKDNTKDPVGFTAVGLKKTTFSAGEVFRMKTVMTNKGDSYDMNTGIFTTPHSGTYVFAAQILGYGVNGNSYYVMNIDLIIDGKVTERAYTKTNDQGASTSLHAVVELQADQKVWLQSQCHGYVRLREIEIENSFSGFSISLDP